MTHVEIRPTRFQDVLAQAGIEAGMAGVPDSKVVTSCYRCRARCRLDMIRVVVRGSETVYVCPQVRCGVDVLIVGPYGTVGAPGRGYRLKGHTIRNPRDVLIEAGNGGLVRLPASPKALD